MDPKLQVLHDVAAQSSDRLDLCARLIRLHEARRVLEIGVYRGAFAAHALAACPSIETYYLLDPWRHLDDWNKPANRDDQTFERFMQEAMDATRDHEHRRVVLRGRTTERIGEISDGSLDFAYVDGDHTLRGITIDLVRVFEKVRPGGWIAGDDFAPSIWQHGADFEPTLVFPFAVHFAEAVGAPIYGLPFRQFLLEKRSEDAFEFVDLTGRYGSLDLGGQVTQRTTASERAARVARQVRRRVVQLRRRGPTTTRP